MELEKLIEIKERSKTKKDGVYSYKGHKYVVVENNIKAYSIGKDIYEMFGIFATKIGRVNEVYELSKKLRELYLS